MPINSWDKIKDIVKNEYPTIKEGGEDFYKLVMTSYKEMNKFASGEDVIKSLHEEGVISKLAVDAYKEEKEYLDIVRTVFEKDASFKSTIKDMGSQAGAGIIIGGGLAAGAGLGKMLTKKLRNRKFDAERGDRIKEIAKFHPTIKEMDPQLLIQAMKDLEELNPSYAKSPLIAGSYLKSVYYGGGLTPEQANTVRNDKKVDDTREIFLKGLSIRGGGGNRSEQEKNSSEPEKSVFNHVKNTAIGGATLMGLAGAFHGGKLLYKNMTRGKRIDAIKQVHPDLKKVNNVDMYLKTMEKLNPTMASDPFAAGVYIKQLMKGNKKGNKADTLHQIADTSDRHDSPQIFRSAAEAFGK